MFLSNCIFGAVLLIAGLAACQGSVRCLDEEGKEIDWWIIYKLPHDDDSDNKWIKEGTGYLYLDSEKSGKFILPEKSINDSQSSAGHTLSQIYNSSPATVGYAMYNDEEPDETKDFMRAHSKGVVSYDSSSGFWLVHSVPRYPPYAKNSYSYPWSGTVYGQSMLCLSLPLVGINKAGRQFQTNGPHFYNYSMPESLQSQLQDLYTATKYNKTVNGTDSNIEMLITTGGNHFTSFAKSTFFNKDLYAALVSPTLKKALLIESWVRGDVVPSCCPPSPNCTYDGYDVETLSFGDIMNFTEKQDHSKWAVAEDKSTLCIGDINRMTSQFHRGGGTVCFENSNAASLYREAVATYYPCEKEKSPGSKEIHLKHKLDF